MKNKFNDWIRKTKKQITNPDKYSETITTISNHLKNSLHRDIDLYKINDVNELINLKEEYFKNNEFFQKNVTGHNMYSRSLELYIEFLSDNKDEADDKIIKKIEQDPSLTEHQKKIIIQSRVGQGKYRNDLINIWNCCAISECKIIELLIASHIKPWSKSTNVEKVDKFNGLLLLPSYDKLFDLGYISFKDNGKILISKDLDPIDYNKLGINDNIIIAIKPNNLKYLNYHRKYIFKGDTNNELVEEIL